MVVVVVMLRSRLWVESPPSVRAGLVELHASSRQFLDANGTIRPDVNVVPPGAETLHVWSPLHRFHVVVERRIHPAVCAHGFWLVRYSRKFVLHFGQNISHELARTLEVPSCGPFAQAL